MDRPLRLRCMTAIAIALALAGCKAEPDAGSEAPATVNNAEPGPAQPEAPPPGPMLPPSFDCTQATGDAQKLICTDQRLAELDKELDRLFALAKADAALGAPALEALEASQRSWLRGRDDCTQSNDLRACILGESVRRIFQLRQGYAQARSDDGGGISRGPTAWKCAGSDALLSSVFVNGEPPSMALAWNDHLVTLEAYPEPEGLRYAGKIVEGDVTFLVSGTRAMLAQPGQPALSCEIEPVG
jgi:uncharacterized protein